MREQNSQFKKDVLKAKAKYRKRRKFKGGTLTLPFTAADVSRYQILTAYSHG